MSSSLMRSRIIFTSMRLTMRTMFWRLSLNLHVLGLSHLVSTPWSWSTIMISHPHQGHWLIHSSVPTTRSFILQEESITSGGHLPRLYPMVVMINQSTPQPYPRLSLGWRKMIPNGMVYQPYNNNNAPLTWTLGLVARIFVQGVLQPKYPSPSGLTVSTVWGGGGGGASKALVRPVSLSFEMDAHLFPIARVALMS